MIKYIYILFFGPEGTVIITAVTSERPNFCKAVKGRKKV